MFENASSRKGSTAKLSVESLEDRTTPAVVGTNGTLDPTAFTSAGPVDRAYLSEAARISFVQAWIGTVEAAQGSDPGLRQFGSQLAAQELAFFNAIFPALTPAGATLQPTQFDAQLTGSFSNQSAAEIDSQFVGLSTLYSLQASALAQAETVLGSSPTVRVVAQQQLFLTQQEILAEAGLLGSSNGLAVLNLFQVLGSFDSIGVPGMVAAGQTATSTTAFGNGFGSGFGTGFGTTGGFGTASTLGVGTQTGFGSGATFGMNTGFGPASTAGGSFNGGFGPGSSFGGTVGGFGPASGF